MNKNFKKRIMTSIALLILLFFMFFYKSILIVTFFLLGVLSILEFLNIKNKIFENYFYKIIINLTFVSYILFFCVFFIFASNYIELKLTLYSLILCCVGSDIGGYITGKFFKGPKLTKISPKKTVSGSIGSLVFASFIFLSTFFLLTNQYDYQIFIVGLFTSVSCQMGDLFFSYFKRKAYIKDSGKFLPGHGGALDRLDGILFGVPLGYLTILSI